VKQLRANARMVKSSIRPPVGGLSVCPSVA